MTTKNHDALDRPRGRCRLTKTQKAAYARARAAEELLQEAKNPPPAWLSDPSLLPKKPPGRRDDST